MRRGCTTDYMTQRDSKEGRKKLRGKEMMEEKKEKKHKRKKGRRQWEKGGTNRRKHGQNEGG